MVTLAMTLLLMAAPTPAQRADQAFAKGRKLLTEGRTKEACAAFDESHSLVPALGALMNLAECEALLGNSPRAYGLYQEAIDWSHRVGNSAREQVALARLEELQPKVALLEIDASAEVIVDTQRVQPKRPLALAPGSHSLIWTAQGKAVSRTLELKAGERRVLREPPPAEAVAEAPAPKVEARSPEPTLEPEPPPPPPPVAVAVEGRPASGTAGVGLMISGAVVAVAGLVALAWSLDVNARLARQQPGQPDFDHPTVSEGTLATASTLFKVSLAGLSVGAVAVVAGTVLWLTAAPAPGGAGIALGGSF